WGCPRIAHQITLAFAIPINKGVVRRILAVRPEPYPAGPSWLTALGHAKDSLWSLDRLPREDLRGSSGRPVSEWPQSCSGDRDVFELSVGPNDARSHWRCQRTTVSGCTTIEAVRCRALARRTQNSRSPVRRCGRGTLRRSTLNCLRSATFSSATARAPLQNRPSVRHETTRQAT